MTKVLHLNKRRASVTQGNLLARSVQQHMTVHENRLIYVAMASIAHEQTDFVTTEIPVTKLEALLGVNSKMLYRIAEETVLSLLERTVVIGSEKEGWTDSPWFGQVGYVPAHKHPKRVSTIQLAFHDNLKPYLLPYLLHEQNTYNTIPLIELLSIPGFTSARIFEVLYHDSGGSQTAVLTYDIKDLKKRIGLEGKYASYGDFRYVLDRARTDLTTYTSMTFNYVGIQQGRSYSHVRFCVFPNSIHTPLPKTLQPARVEENTLDEEFWQLEHDLRAAGYKKEAAFIISKYGVERVRNNLQSAQKKASKVAASAHPVRNLSKLIDYMIENDVASSDAQTIEREPQVMSSRKLQQLSVLLKESFEVDMRGASLRLRASMNEAELADLHDTMRVEVGEFALDQIDRHGWQGATYEAVATAVLCRQQRYLLPQHYQTLAAWTDYQKLFTEYSSQDRTDIINAAEALL